jgi:hypothetical protein
MAACKAQPLAMQSVELRVLEGSFPKNSLICCMHIGILVASPTNSTKSIVSGFNYDFSSASSKHFLKETTNGAISSSSYSLENYLLKSSSSINDSQFTSARLFEVRSFLIFSIESNSRSLQRRDSRGSQPYFLANSPPKRSNS